MRWAAEPLTTFTESRANQLPNAFNAGFRPGLASEQAPASSPMRRRDGGKQGDGTGSCFSLSACCCCRSCSPGCGSCGNRVASAKGSWQTNGRSEGRHEGAHGSSVSCLVAAGQQCVICGS